MSAVLAFECDDHIVGKKEPGSLRWLEGAALAVTMAITGYLTVRWVYEIIGTSIHPRLVIPILLSAAIGFLFGVTIPNGYRRVLWATRDPEPYIQAVDSHRLPPFAPAEHRSG